MRVEIPDINRCCCCVPARYGFLLWTYIRLIFSLMLLFPIIMLNIILFQFFRAIHVIFFLAAVFLHLDVAMNIMAIIGGHMKKTKLLETYFTYSVLSLVLYSIIYVLIVIFNMSSIETYEFWAYIAWSAWIGFGSFFVQIYMLLLLKSILIKLENNCKFRFVNNAAEAEAECVLEINKSFIWNPSEDSEEIDEAKDNRQIEKVEINENKLEVKNRLNNDAFDGDCNKEVDEKITLLEKSEIIL